MGHTDHLTQPRWPNVANPQRSLLKAERGELTGPVLGEHMRLCSHPFGVLPLAAEEQWPTWPQLLLSTAGASQLDGDGQIPSQSS